MPKRASTHIPVVSVERWRRRRRLFNAQKRCRLKLNGLHLSPFLPAPLLFYIHLLICPFAESFSFFIRLFSFIRFFARNRFSFCFWCVSFHSLVDRLFSYFHRFAQSKFMQSPVLSFSLGSSRCCRLLSPLFDMHCTFRVSFCKNQPIYIVFPHTSRERDGTKHGVNICWFQKPHCCSRNFFPVLFR